MKAAQIAVVGGSEASDPVKASAEALGAALASLGAVVICGGLGGVMAAVCRGAKSLGGLTVGVLPGSDPSVANPWVDVVIASGLGEARNAVIVGSAQAVIAVDGEYGTLSEIALALRAGLPVIGLRSWSLTGPMVWKTSGWSRWRTLLKRRRGRCVWWCTGLVETTSAPPGLSAGDSCLPSGPAPGGSGRTRHIPKGQVQGWCW